MTFDKPKLWIVMGGIALLGVTLWGTTIGGKPVATDSSTTSTSTTSTSVRVQPEALRPDTLRQDIVVPAGTRMRIRLDNSISTKNSRPGDHFSATLVSPVAVDKAVILPVGTSVGGTVINAEPSGRLKGRAVLSLRLSTVALNGRTLRISTASDTRVSTGHKKRNLAWIGGGSGGGALIGAIAGGPIGAAIGAGSGAAAGVAGAAITGRKHVSLPVETELTFHLSRPLAVPDRG